MHAYNEMYLEDAMENLGEAMEYAVLSLGMTMDKFLEMFVAEGLAAQFGAGVPKLVSGTSGTELVWETLHRAGKGMQEELPVPRIEYEATPEYWCGWILAYYQWYTGKSFRSIRNIISMDEILRMYPTMHEASEEKFIDVMIEWERRLDLPSQLQQMRRIMGYSQCLLAERSGVSLRMIQQYEQGAKDINKASGSSLLALARTLGCRMEDLMEMRAEG